MDCTSDMRAPVGDKLMAPGASRVKEGEESGEERNFCRKSCLVLFRDCDRDGWTAAIEGATRKEGCMKGRVQGRKMERICGLKLGQDVRPDPVGMYLVELQERATS